MREHLTKLINQISNLYSTVIENGNESAKLYDLPKDLELFYTISDGIFFEYKKILTLSESLKVNSIFQKMPFLGKMQLFPVFDGEDSDYLCVVGCGPLKGFVVQVFHDGGIPNIAYQSISDMLEQFLTFNVVDEPVDEHYSLPSSRINATFQKVLTELKAIICENDEDESIKNSLMLDLVSNDELSILVKLANSSDIAVRYKAYYRLNRLKDDTFDASIIDLSF